MIMKKSQSSTDYLMLLGLIMVIVVVTGIFVWRPREDIILSKANVLMNTVADYVNLVSELGPGNQLRARVEIPSGIDLIKFQRGEMSVLVYKDTERESVLHRLVKANVTGYLSSPNVAPGSTDLIFIALAGGHVCVTRPGMMEEDCYCIDSSKINKPQITHVSGTSYISRTVNDVTVNWGNANLKYGDVITDLKAKCVDEDGNTVPAIVVFSIVNWKNETVFPKTQYESTVFQSDVNGVYHLRGISFPVENSGPMEVRATCYHECHILHDDNEDFRPMVTSEVEIPYGVLRPFVFNITGEKVYLDMVNPDQVRLDLSFFPIKHPSLPDPSRYSFGRVMSGDHFVIRTGYECVGGECIMVNASLWHGGTS
jgi:hypothetical protein